MQHIRVKFVSWVFGICWSYLLAVALGVVSNHEKEYVRVLGTLLVTVTSMLVAISFICVLVAAQPAWF